jgi:DNA mismatch endonuclease, patch repair protein
MDKVSKETRSRNMSLIRAKNTKPELLVRKALHKLGLRYRIHYPLLGKPDIAFPSKKLTIFIHGCFWHGHGCKFDHKPKSNKLFWSSKIIKKQGKGFKK